MGKSDVPVRLLPVVENEAQWSQPLLTIHKMIKRFRLNMIVQPIETKGLGPSAKNIKRFEEVAKRGLDKFKRRSVAERWIRVGELMREHSSKSILNFVTMPYPRKQ